MNRFAALVFSLLIASTALADKPTVLKLWPGTPPGDENVKLGEEKDFTKPTDRLIAGRRIIKLGNVTSPEIHIYKPAKEKDTGTSVVICPGGGHHILAWDLEGTEVAEWLNTIGVTGIVLKYRVPSRTRKTNKWQAAVQDAQRAMSITRHNANKWNLNPNRIGILGFSAGGETAGLTAVFTDRTYQPVDDADKASMLPNFAVLVYPAYMADAKTGKLQEHVRITANTPPMFLAHAYDDRVTPLTSLLLAVELKKNNVPAELHMYATGGHGFGMRPTDEPCTHWPKACAKWMGKMGWLEKGK